MLKIFGNLTSEMSKSLKCCSPYFQEQYLLCVTGAILSLIFMTYFFSVRVAPESLTLDAVCTELACEFAGDVSPGLLGGF